MNAIATADRTAGAAGSQDYGVAAAGTTHQQFITFTLGSEEYGVDIMKVREIKGWTPTTTLPQSPPHVRGVINLRGVIVPILDLRARFGMGTTKPTGMHVVIIVNTGTRTSGLLVDAVSDIISIEPDAVRAVPEMETPIGDQYLSGLVALGERMVTLVSLDRLLETGTNIGSTGTLSS